MYFLSRENALLFTRLKVRRCPISALITLSSWLFLYASDDESVSSQHPSHGAESTAHRKSPATPGKICHTKWGRTVEQFGWCVEHPKVFYSTKQLPQRLANKGEYLMICLYYLIRSKWPNGDQIPPYLPEFNDGWQPLPPGPSKSPPSSSQLSRSNSERVPPRNAMQRPPEQVKSLIGQTSTDLSMRIS